MLLEPFNESSDAFQMRDTIPNHVHRFQISRNMIALKPVRMNSILRRAELQFSWYRGSEGSCPRGSLLGSRVFHDVFLRHREFTRASRVSC